MNWQGRSSRMIWLTTAGFFALSAAYFCVCFWLYANILLRLGGSGWFAKNILGFMVYLLFSCVFVAPMLVVLAMFESWRIAFVSDPIYLVYFMCCFLLSVLPGAIYFKKRYLGRLRECGYFRKRCRGKGGSGNIF